MNFKSFWKKKIDLIEWSKKPKEIYNKTWFNDGKLNISYNCIDTNILNGLREKVALVFYDKNYNKFKYTYKDLLILTKNFSRQLNSLTRKKKPRVMIHGSASIETTVSMLACSRLGLFHSVIFNELNYESIKIRVKLFKPDIIISRANDKDIKKKFNKYLNKLVIFRSNNTELKVKKKISIDKIYGIKSQKKNRIENFLSNSNFFCLFTSGSTGEPKGIIHSMGPYLIYAKYTCMKYFGMNKNSVVLTASDAGWINGHTYALYGPLSLGSKTIILESPLMILDDIFLEKIIKNEKITILYLPVTLIRLLKGILRKKIVSKSLKTLGSMGEPLAPSIGEWFAKKFNLKNKSIINTYFQTETGGIITAPTHKDLTDKHPHGSVGKINHLVGMLIERKTKEIILKYPWPGCFKSVINGKKIEKKYWNTKKYFRMFDLGSKINNSLYINGRTDDVLNVRGHRIGSEEIESILLKIKEIYEISAVGIPDAIEGNKIVIFAKILKKKINIFKEIEKKLIENFGTFALPKDIIIVKNLPKTRSGKIMRRVLREIYLNPANPNLGDLSTILDKNTVSEIQFNIKNKKYD